MFTLTDKVLLDRAARLIKDEARELLNAACPPGGWGATADSRKHKLVYDRLVRDERDLRMLGKRLCAHFDVHAVRGAVVMEAASTVLGTAGPIGSVMTAIEALANLPAVLLANAPRQDTAEVGDPLNALSPEARADYLSALGPGSNRDFSGLKFDTNPGSGTSQVPDAKAEDKNVPRETFEGKPELTPATVGGNVNPVTGLGGNDVGF